ncbi:MAG: CrcB family protein, partial [Chloroflexia bacterium]|nr:CrcB family protein [Chloroflexia bacterium]
LLITGFLGGFTTFSAYTINAITLIEAGSWNTALLYVMASNLLSLLACLAGIVAIRMIM